MRRPPIRPPVTDSATPRVQPWVRRSSRTTDSIVSASTPNTMSLISRRTRCSQVSSTSCTVSTESDFAVSRTLMPSQPLARKANVGLPTSSNSLITVSSRSLRADSDSPHVRNTRDAITDCDPLRCSKSGRMARANMSCISWGTPGTA